MKNIIELFNNGLTVVSGIITINSAQVMLNGYMDGLSEDVRTFSSDLYIELDKMNNNMKATDGKVLYDNVLERESIIDSATSITADKNLNPVLILKDLEALMNTGNFNNTHEAMEFDATLREMLYNEGHSTDEVSTIVSGILEKMKNGESLDGALKANLSDELYQKIGGADGLTEDELLKYIAEYENEIAEEFKNWVAPPIEQTEIEKRKDDLANRILSLEYNGVLSADEELIWAEMGVGQDYGGFKYDVIAGKPTFVVIPPSYIDENGVINYEAISEEDYDSFVKYDYKTAKFNEVAHTVINQNRYRASQISSEEMGSSYLIDSETASDSQVVEVNQDQYTDSIGNSNKWEGYAYPLAINNPALGGFSSFGNSEETTNTSTLNSQSTLDSSTLDGNSNQLGQLDYMSNQLDVIEQGFSLIKNSSLSSSSFNAEDAMNSTITAVEDDHNDELWERFSSILVKALSSPKEVIVNNVVEKYTDVNEVIDVIAKSVASASVKTPGVTQKYRM